MNNYLQVELGGRKRGLKFNLGTFFTAKEAIDFPASATISKDHKDVAIIVYSALMSNCRSKKEEPDFNFDEVVEWVLEIENIDTLNTISLMFAEITNTKDTGASGEGSADTQQAA